MCHACGMNHFEEDDIDYDDEELMAILGIDSLGDRLNNTPNPNQQMNKNSQNTSPVFIAVEKQDTQIKGVRL